MRTIRFFFVLSIISFIPFTPARSNHSSTLENAFLMGSSTVDVTPNKGVPLGGYGGKLRRIIPWDVCNKYPYAHFLKPSKGVLDPIRSKALVIAQGTQKLLFLSLDVVGVEAAMVNEIQSYAATLGVSHSIVSATHTHSGPGAIGRNKFFAIFATDRFNQKVYDRFMAGVKQSIDQAMHRLEPVKLYSADFKAVGIQRNRRHHSGRYDSNAHLLYGRNGCGEIVGGMVNLAVHSTVHDEDNLHFSADFAGGLERHLTQRLGAKNTILFVNGAEGDVSPNTGGVADIELRGAEFAEQAASGLANSVEITGALQVKTAQFKMPKGKIVLGRCLDKIPKALRKIAFGNKKWFPRDFELTHVQIGDILMMSWPGEPTTLLGAEGIQLAQANGFQKVWNLGLTNGYMGYFLLESEFPEGGYEVCVSYHGPKAAEALLNGHAALFTSSSRSLFSDSK